MKKFLKSPWTIGISTTLLGFILTVGYDLIKGKQVFTTIGKFFSMLWSWIITFLTLDLKVWWVLLGIAVLFFVLYAVAKISEPKEQVKPAFTNYTQDRFRLWKWSWNWEWSSYHKQWHVANLHAHCPQCDTPMNHDQYRNYDYQHRRFQKSRKRDKSAAGQAERRRCYPLHTRHKPHCYY